MIFPSFAAHFGTLHFDKSSNTAKCLEKMKKNLSIIPLHKCLLLAPKMFIVHWGTISAYFPLLSKQLGKYLKSLKRMPLDCLAGYFI